jgi:hypothetical protein
MESISPRQKLYSELLQHKNQYLPDTDRCRITSLDMFEDSPTIHIVITSDAEELEEHFFEKLMLAIYKIAKRISITYSAGGIKISQLNLNGGTEESFGFNLFDSSANLVDPVIKKYLISSTLIDSIVDKIYKQHYLLPIATVERANQALVILREQKNRPTQLINKLEHHNEGEIELNLLTSMRETGLFRYEFNINKKNIIVFSEPRKNYTIELDYMLTKEDGLTLTYIDTDPEKLQYLKLIDTADKKQMIIDFYHKMRKHLEPFKIKFQMLSEDSILPSTTFNFPQV